MSGYDMSLFPENTVIVHDSPWYTEQNKNIVLIMLEPEVIGHLRRPVLQNISNFYQVYTCDEEILARFPEKSRRYLGNCGSWFRDGVVMSLPKEFKISSMTGTKCFHGVPGHALRQHLYFNQNLFPSNCVFFRSGADDPLPEIANNPIVPYNVENRVDKGWSPGKEVLFDGFQFSIVIENSRQTNYFTEKILDCLLTKTIPVYWGCPNIGEFFDTTGWIFFQTKDDLLASLNALDADYYGKYADVVEKNRVEALKYQNYFDSFNRQAREYQS